MPYRVIELTQGRVAQVDEADYEWLNGFAWHAARSGYGDIYYAYRRVNGKRIKMEHMIVAPPDGMIIDHIDRNTLNNQRSNLRITTQSVNIHNRTKQPGSSLYRGISRRPDGSWLSQAWKDGQHYYIGIFDGEREAALAYDRVAKQLWGDYAVLNFSEGER
jgi:hypothetical protein